VKQGAESARATNSRSLLGAAREVPSEQGCEHQGRPKPAAPGSERMKPHGLEVVPVAPASGRGRHPWKVTGVPGNPAGLAETAKPRRRLPHLRCLAAIAVAGAFVRFVHQPEITPRQSEPCAASASFERAALGLHVEGGVAPGAPPDTIEASSLSGGVNVEESWFRSRSPDVCRAVCGDGIGAATRGRGAGLGADQRHPARGRRASWNRRGRASHRRLCGPADSAQGRQRLRRGRRGGRDGRDRRARDERHRRQRLHDRLPQGHRQGLVALDGRCGAEGHRARRDDARDAECRHEGGHRARQPRRVSHPAAALRHDVGGRGLRPGHRIREKGYPIDRMLAARSRAARPTSRSTRPRRRSSSRTASRCARAIC
jgi:hypothetical protein